MLRKDLIKKNPAMIILGSDNLHHGKFGCVVSRAGVGKTQFLVQIALTRLFENEKVLHISLCDAMEKINVRYKEGYFSLIDSIGYIDPLKANRLWEDVDSLKTGITYQDAASTPQRIRDYLKTLYKGDIPLPSMMVVDGLDFDHDQSGILDEFDALADEFSVTVWFSMQSHREESLCDDGYPRQLENVKDYFKKALFLRPANDKIEAVIIKDGGRQDQKFILDPATMMLAI